MLRTGFECLDERPSCEVAKQIWVCEDKSVKLWKDDIRAYKVGAHHAITPGRRASLNALGAMV